MAYFSHSFSVTTYSSAKIIEIGEDCSGPPLRLGAGDETITASDRVRLLGVTSSFDL